MDKGKKRLRAVELLKDVLIVLLTCSALWLMTRTQLLEFLREEDAQSDVYQAQSSALENTARPLRITASVMGETGLGLCGIQYDQTAADDLFQRVAGLLAEALSSAGQPEQITRAQWEKALTTPPAVCLDFQGEIPMEILSGWLTGETMEESARVRRLVLGVWKESVALYYRDEESGRYCRRLSEVANSQHLVEAIASLRDNGAFYAFQSEQYRWLAPDTLISQATPTPGAYQAGNPVAQGQSSLEWVIGTLGLPVSSGSFYSVGDEWVARMGGSNLRLSAAGVLEYHGEEGGSLFAVSPQPESASLFDAAEACRQLAVGTLGAGAGQARLYLSAIREGEDGLEVEFDYCLDGIPVCLEDGAAAWFLVQDGQITRFILRFRSYTEGGTSASVLPLPQAAAAMEALDLEGAELLLVYNDTGETVSPSWAALNGGA